MVLPPLYPSSTTSTTPDSRSSSIAKRTRSARRSLSFLGKDLSSLIRSHSNDQHDSPEYAEPIVMADDRPGRKSKSENRLYNFLTRSRSRSRSKHAQEQPSAEPPQVPKKDYNPASKPPSRIPSRPISTTTTTTTTTTTITPGTPKPRRRPQLSSSPPQDTTPTKPNIAESSHIRPITPKQPTTRQKFHSIFTLPFVGTRKSPAQSRSASCSQSRPGTPRASLDVPPLPIIDDPTPKPRKSFSPLPTGSRPQSPSPATAASPNGGSGALKLPKLFTTRNAPVQNAVTLQRRPTYPPKALSASGTPSTQPQASSNLVSVPLKRASQHRPALSVPSTSATPHKSTQIPAIPSVSKRTGQPLNVPQPSQLRKGSLRPNYRFGLSTTAEDGPATPADGTSSFKPAPTTSRNRGGSREERSNRRSATVASGKHGSFDFERPGWSAAMMQRSTSGGTGGSGSRSGSAWDAEMEENVKQRESTWGPGFAGVGTLQRDASFRRGREREEMLTKAREVSKREKERDKGTLSQRTTPQGSTSAHSDHLNASTSTNGTGTHTGKSSSLSRATGKRSIFGGKSSARKALVLSAQHGLFAFEPPVPSPTRSTRSAGSTGDGQAVRVEWDRDREKERERGKERSFGTRRGGDRAAVPVPLPSSLPTYGHRSGTKGRSLDLGLGLAWAPSRVKETALLPSSTFFGRSTSRASRSTAGTGGTGTGEDEGEHSHGGVGEDRPKIGREVAGLFRGALDDYGYATFKKYVHQFDAHEIPFDGPTGIITRVERLLAGAPGIGEETRKRLLDSFIRIILHNA